MTYVLLHAAVFALTLLLLACAGFLGDALLVRRPTPWFERIVPWLTFSFGTWIVAAFALCAVHGFTRPIVAVLAGVICIGAVVAWRRRAPSLELGEGRDRSRLLITVPIGVILLALFALALTPIPAWDADHYHLTIPRLFVEATGFKRVPFSLQSNWPLNAELLYGLILLFSDHVSAALVHYAFGVATCSLLLAGAMQADANRGRWVGTLAVACFLSNPIVEYEFYVAYIDLAVTFFFLASFLSIWKAFEDPDQSRMWLLTAGISAGLLAGTKVNGIISVLVLGLFGAYQFLRTTKRPALRDAALYGVFPAFLLAVVWPIKSWVLTGNPVYPFLYGRFGGGEWSEELTRQFGDAMWGMGMGRTPKDYLLLPVRVILSGDNDFTHFFGRLTAAWIVLIPIAVVFGWRNRLARACLGVAALHFVSWASASQQMRFLLPAIALLSLGTGIALMELGGRSRVARLALSVGTAGLLLFSSVPMLTSAADWTAVYFRNGSKLPGGVVKPIYTFIDKRLPTDARVLLLNTSLTYFVRRPYIVDSVFQASQIGGWMKDAATPADVHTKLKAAGVTHVLAMEHSEGAQYPAALTATIERKQGIRLLFHDPKSESNLFEVCRDPTCAYQ